MKILLAKQAGFCFGVKRATQMAFEAAEKGTQTYTLGPIIHSPQVVQKLEEMGVKVLNNISDQESGTIIIRSHGVAAEELDEAVRKALDIIDATCPFVKKAQEHVASLSQAGYDVVVVGDADHPEVQGIVSYAKGRVLCRRLRRRSGQASPHVKDRRGGPDHPVLRKSEKRGVAVPHERGRNQGLPHHLRRHRRAAGRGQGPCRSRWIA